MPRAAYAARVCRLLLAVIVVALSGIAQANAQAAETSVPKTLMGKWRASFTNPDLLPFDLHLKADSAGLYSEGGTDLGMVLGTFSDKAEVTLTVLWRISAFQRKNKDFPEAVWAKAVADHGDAAHPNLVKTTLKLQYDGTKDELSGEYVELNIVHDNDKYQETKTATVDIRMTRVKVKPIAIRIMADKDPFATLDSLNMDGDTFMVELSYSDYDDPVSDAVTVVLHTTSGGNLTTTATRQKPTDSAPFSLFRTASIKITKPP